MIKWKTMSRLRVSAISFLNTAPLMWDFDHGDLRRHFRVDYTLPAACAEMLRTGMADIGIIPVAAYATIPDLLVIPDVAIASRGPVRSIYLISKVPVDQIKRLALDTSSRTSVALLKILLHRFYQTSPEFVPMEPQLGPMIENYDAGLLIGDPALLAFARLTPGEFHVYDLGEEWRKFTGKDFVFAFWAVRGAASADAQVVNAFQRSRDHGLEPQNIVAIAREWAIRLGLSREHIISYLTEAIYYRLEPPQLEGLALFYRYAAECGVLPPAPALRFL
jgi:chorismate dehydratase